MKSELGIISGPRPEFKSLSSSKEAATGIIERYPDLVQSQIKIIFDERNSGGNLASLVSHNFLTTETNPKQRNLLRNVIEESASIDDLVVLCNLGLIIKVANKYKVRGIEFEDSMQEGTFGLYRCLDSYDYKKSMFSTYATNAIENAVRAAARSNHAPALRYPADLQDAIRTGKRSWNRLALELQKEPAYEDLYADLVTQVPREVDARRAAEIIVHQTDSVISLDVPILRRTGDVNQISLGDLLPDNSTHSNKWVEAIHGKHVNATVNKALSSDILSEDEARLLKLRFGFGGRDPMGHEEIGKEVGLSRPSVGRKLAEIIGKLRDSGIFAYLVAE